jgi:DNA repair protein RadC
VKTIKKLSIHCERVSLQDPAAHYAKVVASSRDVARIAQELCAHEDQEVFLVFCLDVKNRIVGYSEVARGLVDHAPVHVRETFRTAILQGASGVILVHNHPSGDPAPSDADHDITARLVQAGEIIGIRVLDHVIVAAGSERYYSFLDTGALPKG